MCISHTGLDNRDEDVFPEYSSDSDHSHDLQCHEIEEEDIPGWFEDYPPPSDSSNTSVTPEQALRLNLEEGLMTPQEYEEELQELQS